MLPSLLRAWHCFVSFEPSYGRCLPDFLPAANSHANAESHLGRKDEGPESMTCVLDPQVYLRALVLI